MPWLNCAFNRPEAEITYRNEDTQSILAAINNGKG